MILKKHKNDHESTTRVFRHNHCEKDFTEKWKMCDNVKKIKKYKFDLCVKTLKYLDLKKKYLLEIQDNVNIYCHIFKVHPCLRPACLRL